MTAILILKVTVPNQEFIIYISTFMALLTVCRVNMFLPLYLLLYISKNFVSGNVI